MNKSERRAYFVGSIRVVEHFKIALDTIAPGPAAILNCEQVTTEAVAEAVAYLHELAAWVRRNDENEPVPHPRIRRVTV